MKASRLLIALLGIVLLGGGLALIFLAPFGTAIPSEPPPPLAAVVPPSTATPAAAKTGAGATPSPSPAAGGAPPTPAPSSAAASPPGGSAASAPAAPAASPEAAPKPAAAAAPAPAAEKGPPPRPLSQLITPSDTLSASPAPDSPPPPDLVDGTGKAVAAAMAIPAPWTIEVGLFASQQRAKALAADLAKTYPGTTVSSWAAQDGTLWYSATLPAQQPLLAQDQARRIEAQGFRPAVAVPPPPKAAAAPPATPSSSPPPQGSPAS
jgi:hypothetical protein